MLTFGNAMLTGFNTPKPARGGRRAPAHRGGLTTKTHVLCEGQGKPVVVEITPGEQHEVTQATTLLDGVAVGGKPGPPETL